MKLKVVVVDLEIPPRVTRWGLRLGIPALVLSVAAVALAAPLHVWNPNDTLTAAELNGNFSDLQAQVVPSGAVLAFNLSACPTGWTTLPSAGGRTIIGVNPAGGNGLSQRNLSDTPGEETHTMSLAEMPSHTHTARIFQNVASFADGTPGLIRQGGAFQATFYGDSEPSDPTGGGGRFNQMQPSLALLYCQKS